MSLTGDMTLAMSGKPRTEKNIEPGLDFHFWLTQFLIRAQEALADWLSPSEKESSETCILSQLAHHGDRPSNLPFLENVGSQSPPT